MVTNEPKLDIKAAIALQREFFATGKTKSYEFRKTQLEKLEKLIKEHDQIILDALHQDLRKPAIEAFGSEVLGSISEIKYILKHLRSFIQINP